MIERLRDFRVKLKVDGQLQSLTVTARTPNAAKIEGIRRARRLLESDLIEVVSVEAKVYKPYA